MSSANEIKMLARQNVVAFLDVSVTNGEGDLWVQADELDDDEQAKFVAEVQHIIERIRKTIR